MLPALMRAEKIAKKAGLVDGTSPTELAGGISAALPSLAAGGCSVVGRILFDLCRLAALHGADAEEALGAEVERVIEAVEKNENSVNI